MENVKLAGSETIKLFNDRENVREKPRLMIPTINLCLEVGAEPSFLGYVFPLLSQPWSKHPPQTRE